MTTIYDLNLMTLRELDEICTLYAMGVSVGNNGSIEGLYKVRR